MERHDVSNRDAVSSVTGVFVAFLRLAVRWPVTSRTASPDETRCSQGQLSDATLCTADVGWRLLRPFQSAGQDCVGQLLAPSCLPCREETSALQASYYKLEQERLVMVGVDRYNQERIQGRGEQAMREFTGRYGGSA